MTIRIATYITAGVVIGVSLGAMFTCSLPIWLGLSVCAAVSYVASLA